ncbi:O-fucosyltransferase 1 [Camellia lanceoleosa]|uniref:O-fucosyltransferase 1 n=1 Tax=Camellia lanceoleosa TaxID=1840588 RepID=A0ACC0G9B2_9ERIC|nr:O-fucosyltransferase 1 [Camellia lanceoleosa]
MTSCFDIFTTEEQRILKKYWKENFAEKKLVYSERRATGKSPLTPEELLFVGSFRLDGIPPTLRRVP